jgi:hypothetical protein
MSTQSTKLRNTEAQALFSAIALKGQVRLANLTTSLTILYGFVIALYV